MNWQFLVTWTGTGGVAIWLAALTWRRDDKANDNAEGRLDLDSLTATVDRLDREVGRLDERLKREIARSERAEARELEERAARRHAVERADRAEEKVDRLAASLAAHGQWDLLVLAEVRKSSPDFPSPPPVVIADLS